MYHENDARRKFPYEDGIIRLILGAAYHNPNTPVTPLQFYETIIENLSQISQNIPNLRKPGPLEFWEYLEILIEEKILDVKISDDLRDEFLSNAIKKAIILPTKKKGICIKTKLEQLQETLKN